MGNARNRQITGSREIRVLRSTRGVDFSDCPKIRINSDMMSIDWMSMSVDSRIELPYQLMKPSGSFLS
ncbi:hypothetical protein TIFTF001_015430 [Ficus carica]|uniref:Uncharacterized protein n=1 Tax=Ficus carica TaxID=3494 RepID=A0AA88A4F8_FICCA|nr:hypothetical protein TIFTF001_015430 [Ficus carica]